MPLLVVEVADTSLYYDLNTKASIYALYGVHEYWVINAVTLFTMVHRQPSGKSWDFVDEVAPAGTLTPSRLPAFAVSLGAFRARLIRRVAAKSSLWFVAPPAANASCTGASCTPNLD